MKNETIVSLIGVTLIGFGGVIGYLFADITDGPAYRKEISELQQKAEKFIPYAATSLDLNNDGLNDIVVHSLNQKYIFLGSTNGRYTSFNDYKLMLETEEKIRTDNSRSNLESSLKQIEDKAGEIKR